MREIRDINRIYPASRDRKDPLYPEKVEYKIQRSRNIIKVNIENRIGLLVP